VLIAGEIVRFLEAAPDLQVRAALTTGYGAGLRASEVVSLKVGDIDSDNGGHSCTTGGLGRPSALAL
jgi:integrase